LIDGLDSNRMAWAMAARTIKNMATAANKHAARKTL
jgi:hypothetical protein